MDQNVQREEFEDFDILTATSPSQLHRARKQLSRPAPRTARTTKQQAAQQQRWRLEQDEPGGSTPFSTSRRLTTTGAHSSKRSVQPRRRGSVAAAQAGGASAVSASERGRKYGAHNCSRTGSGYQATIPAPIPTAGSNGTVPVNVVAAAAASVANDGGEGGMGLGGIACLSWCPQSVPAAEVDAYLNTLSWANVPPETQTAGTGDEAAPAADADATTTAAVAADTSAAGGRSPPQEHSRLLQAAALRCLHAHGYDTDAAMAEWQRPGGACWIASRTPLDELNTTVEGFENAVAAHGHHMRDVERQLILDDARGGGASEAVRNGCLSAKVVQAFYWRGCAPSFRHVMNALHLVEARQHQRPPATLGALAVAMAPHRALSLPFSRRGQLFAEIWNAYASATLNMLPTGPAASNISAMTLPSARDRTFPYQDVENFAWELQQKYMHSTYQQVAAVNEDSKRTCERVLWQVMLQRAVREAREGLMARQLAARHAAVAVHQSRQAAHQHQEVEALFAEKLQALDDKHAMEFSDLQQVVKVAAEQQQQQQQQQQGQQQEQPQQMSQSGVTVAVAETAAPVVQVSSDAGSDGAVGISAAIQSSDHDSDGQTPPDKVLVARVIVSLCSVHSAAVDSRLLNELQESLWLACGVARNIGTILGLIAKKHPLRIPVFDPGFGVTVAAGRLPNGDVEASETPAGKNNNADVGTDLAPAVMALLTRARQLYHELFEDPGRCAILPSSSQRDAVNTDTEESVPDSTSDVGRSRRSSRPSRSQTAGGARGDGVQRKANPSVPWIAPTSARNLTWTCSVLANVRTCRLPVEPLLEIMYGPDAAATAVPQLRFELDAHELWLEAAGMFLTMARKTAAGTTSTAAHVDDMPLTIEHINMVLARQATHRIVTTEARTAVRELTSARKSAESWIAGVVKMLKLDPTSGCLVHSTLKATRHVAERYTVRPITALRRHLQDAMPSKPHWWCSLREVKEQCLALKDAIQRSEAWSRLAKRTLALWVLQRPLVQGGRGASSTMADGREESGLNADIAVQETAAVVRFLPAADPGLYSLFHAVWWVSQAEKLYVSLKKVRVNGADEDLPCAPAAHPSCSSSVGDGASEPRVRTLTLGHLEEFIEAAQATDAHNLQCGLHFTVNVGAGSAPFTVSFDACSCLNLEKSSVFRSLDLMRKVASELRSCATSFALGGLLGSAGAVNTHALSDLREALVHSKEQPAVTWLAGVQQEGLKQVAISIEKAHLWVLRANILMPKDNIKPLSLREAEQLLAPGDVLPPALTTRAQLPWEEEQGRGLDDVHTQAQQQVQAQAQVQARATSQALAAQDHAGAPASGAAQPLFPAGLDIRNPVFADKIREFYIQHNPAKVNQLGTILACYQGKESTLLCDLDYKYATGHSLQRWAVGRFTAAGHQEAREVHGVQGVRAPQAVLGVAAALVQPQAPKLQQFATLEEIDALLQEMAGVHGQAFRCIREVVDNSAILQKRLHGARNWLKEVQQLLEKTRSDSASMEKQLEGGAGAAAAKGTQGHRPSLSNSNAPVTALGGVDRRPSWQQLIQQHAQAIDPTKAPTNPPAALRCVCKKKRGSCKCGFAKQHAKQLKEDANEFWVDKVVEIRLVLLLDAASKVPLQSRHTAEYFTAWWGYGAEDNTWEPASNLTGGNSVREFVLSRNAVVMQQLECSAAALCLSMRTRASAKANELVAMEAEHAGHAYLATQQRKGTGTAHTDETRLQMVDLQRTEMNSLQAAAKGLCGGYFEGVSNAQLQTSNAAANRSCNQRGAPEGAWNLLYCPAHEGKDARAVAGSSAETDPLKLAFASMLRDSRLREGLKQPALKPMVPAARRLATAISQDFITTDMTASAAAEAVLFPPLPLLDVLERGRFGIAGTMEDSNFVAQRVRVEVQLAQVSDLLRKTNRHNQQWWPRLWVRRWALQALLVLTDLRSSLNCKGGPLEEQAAQLSLLRRGRKQQKQTPFRISLVPVTPSGFCAYYRSLDYGTLLAHPKRIAAGAAELVAQHSLAFVRLPKVQREEFMAVADPPAPKTTDCNSTSAEGTANAGHPAGSGCSPLQSAMMLRADKLLREACVFQSQVVDISTQQAEKGEDGAGVIDAVIFAELRAWLWRAAVARALPRGGRSVFAIVGKAAKAVGAEVPSEPATRSLPEGWVQDADIAGCPFYLNERLIEVTWQRPLHSNLTRNAGELSAAADAITVQEALGGHTTTDLAHETLFPPQTTVAMLECLVDDAALLDALPHEDPSVLLLNEALRVMHAWHDTCKQMFAKPPEARSASSSKANAAPLKGFALAVGQNLLDIGRSTGVVCPMIGRLETALAAARIWLQQRTPFLRRMGQIEDDTIDGRCPLCDDTRCSHLLPRRGWSTDTAGQFLNRCQKLDLVRAFELEHAANELKGSLHQNLDLRMSSRLHGSGKVDAEVWATAEPARSAGGSQDLIGRFVRKVGRFCFFPLQLFVHSAVVLTTHTRHV